MNFANTTFTHLHFGHGSKCQQDPRMTVASSGGKLQYRHSWYIRMAPMYECSIGPSSTLGFSKVFFGLLIFGGIFRYLLIENSGILVFWYFGIFRAI